MAYPVAILQDLAGPKIRVGSVTDPGIRLETGRTFVLTGQQWIQEGPRDYAEIARQYKEQGYSVSCLVLAKYSPGK